MKATNFENFRKTLAERTDLTKKEKQRLYKQKKEQHKQEIYKEIEDYFFFERNEDGVFIITGEDDDYEEFNKLLEDNRDTFEGILVEPYEDPNAEILRDYYSTRL